jgi:hypothetical protein
MLENVIYENEQEAKNYKPKGLTNKRQVDSVCQIIRNMYFDCMVEFMGDIHDEEFFYNIPTEDRKVMVETIRRFRKNSTMTQSTYDAIMALSLSSLEYLMIIEYEKEIDGDCDSIVFSIKVS